MTLTITITTVIAIVGLLTGVLLLLPRLGRPTVPFGVRVPTGHADAPAVRRATTLYSRGLLVTLPSIAALLVALAVLLPAGVILAAAALVPLVAWFVLYLSARRTVQAAKRDERWYEGLRQAVATDTSLRTSPPPYPWRWAVPAIVVTLVTAAIGAVRYPSLPDRIATRLDPTPAEFIDTTVWSAFALVGIQLVLTLIMLGVAAVAVRGKADLIATAPATSADQHRRYAATMARCVLLVAAGQAITVLMLALMTWELVPRTTAWAAASSLPTVAAAAVLVVVAVRTGQSGHRLATAGSDPAARPGVEHRDDDAHWIAGLLYINRDDPAILVPARFGDVGWTLNLAHPAVWMATAVALVITAASLLWAII
jgi:uncharacterized membrane protein